MEWSVKAFLEITSIQSSVLLLHPKQSKKYGRLQVFLVVSFWSVLLKLQGCFKFVLNLIIPRKSQLSNKRRLIADLLVGEKVTFNHVSVTLERSLYIFPLIDSLNMIIITWAGACMAATHIYTHSFCPWLIIITVKEQQTKTKAAANPHLYSKQTS